MFELRVRTNRVNRSKSLKINAIALKSFVEMTFMEIGKFAEI